MNLPKMGRGPLALDLPPPAPFKSENSALPDIQRAAALFGRRAVQRIPDPPVHTAVKAPASVNFRLLGLLEMSGLRTAVLQGGEPSKVVRLKEGDKFEGWTVSSIRSRAIQLENMDVGLILDLDPHATGPH